MEKQIKDILQSEQEEDNVTVHGWVRTKRDSKAFSFVELNDGSCLGSIQIIVDATLPDYSAMATVHTGAALQVSGKLVASPGKGQKWEIQAREFAILGASDATYPLQKKGHSLEYLREIAHLRPRSNLFGCVFRLRSRLSYAVHTFFQERGFFYVHTPIITASDCEGAGELFRVSTLDPEKLPKKDGRVDYNEDFFHRMTYLTVSGQLQAEAFATALSRVYTFSPTFRAENSNTARHASEFWMIEPEMAFCDLNGNMDLAEELVKYLVTFTLENCEEEVNLFSRFVDKTLKERLEFVAEKPFKRLAYTEAVEILQATGKKFEYPVSFGVNLQTEHERYLTEEHFKCPVTLYNYPKTIKPFYMRSNDDDKTVAAMDVLVPGIGEIVGGSQREERLDVLLANLKRHNLSEEEYAWYVDLRKFGTVPHSGFGLGFERMLMFVSGVANIRDVVPFARTPGNAGF